MAQINPDDDAPEGEEMDRSPLTAPELHANLTFQGATTVIGETGMVLNPLGLFSCQKALQMLFCPKMVQAAIPYVSGDYTEGIQIDQVPASCCGKPYYSISLKDYTQVQADEDMTGIAGAIAKKAVKSMRDKGVSDAKIALTFPKTTVVGGTFVKNHGGVFGVARKGSANEDKPKYIVKNTPNCLKAFCTFPAMDNCKKGILRGNLCMQVKTPIFNASDQSKVATIVQLVPLFPTGPICAGPGPTLQMSIHKEPGVELEPEDVARVALFMYTVKPNLPPDSSGGPVRVIGAVLGNPGLSIMGWALGYAMDNVTTEYVSLKQVMNGEIAGIGDFLDRIRGKK